MPSSTSSPIALKQQPSPQSHFVRHSGDLLKVSLSVSPAARGGAAWVRTNLGGAQIHRQEVVDHCENGAAMLGRDWTDLPMRDCGNGRFEITLPLHEAGIFEFKAYYVDPVSRKSCWPRGENCRVKVAPALSFAKNTIYNAFVRQFGANISGGASSPELSQCASQLDQAGYAVIPPSGTFRDLGRHLEFIQEDLGFRIIQLLPVHPVPTTFARMGRYGSPFAPLDFFAVDAGMAQFDRHTTPLEQFVELVDCIHGRGGLVFIDLPIDHTGWASILQNQHPEWFCRNQDGSFASPGAWGVVWEDLCKLDFSCRQLWPHIAEVFLHWCRNGVDGFRCDAGYMIPAEAWNYIICKVRLQYPSTIFFLEGLGGGQDATTRLLSEAGMDWAYSELFQNYSAKEIAGYADFAARYSASNGALVNFAETHDNERLAGKGAAWSRLRVALAALFAPAGCFGIANGVEWLATERIDVHDAGSLNWGSAQNIIPLIRRLNELLASHPAFTASATMRTPYGAGGGANGMLRIPAGKDEYAVMVVANPEINRPAQFEWNMQEFDPHTSPVDLITGRRVPVRYDNCQVKVALAPGEVLCLTSAEATTLPKSPVSAVQRQLMRAAILKFVIARHGYGDASALDLDGYCRALYANPLEFLQSVMGVQEYLPVVQWRPNRDERRMVPLPPGHHLMVAHSQRFIATISRQGRCLQKFISLPQADGGYFVLFQPLPESQDGGAVYTLGLNVFSGDGSTARVSAPLLSLPPWELRRVRLQLSHDRISVRHCALSTTALGGYSLMRAAWGNLDSQYDAMLAANLDAGIPVDRTVVLARCRAWLVHRDYSQEINLSCQRDFIHAPDGSSIWRFIIPTGMGGNVFITIRHWLERESGMVHLQVTRCVPPGSHEHLNVLNADAPVTVLLRPDIDDRCNHASTVAFPDCEREFPRRLSPQERGFNFGLHNGQCFMMRSSSGEFLPAQEWNYNLFYRLEHERGLRDHGDLYSPGMFRFELLRGQCVEVAGGIGDGRMAAPETPQAQPYDLPPECMESALPAALDRAIDAFVVRRGSLKTVIAGYPWFLDWGRDTLICLRGMIASGRLADSLAAICAFASFEDHGTLPNMISGGDLSNRETSDAPLLLFVAVDDYIKAVEGKTDADAVLSLKCGGRTLLGVLESIAAAYIAGTANGIKMDAASGLVFSPSHFTWMDTNYPAATPREGYPVEIQALWFFALRFLSLHAGQGDRYGRLAEKVRSSLNRLFPLPEESGGGLSDCLHAAAGQGAGEAEADDAVRPNQLWAVTLGAIESPQLVRRILDACAALVIPGGIRSLADQPVHWRQPVYGAKGLLNNPEQPYWGSYSGDEDTRRKVAYHNGTAWCWQLPMFCEALFRAYGPGAKDAALAILGTAADAMGMACIGHLPEIIDGSLPHLPRGCCAQAWSATEFRRVAAMLSDPNPSPGRDGAR